MALGLSRYVYGTTRLGDDSIPFEDRVAIARSAIDAGLSIHTSHQYGDALKVLRAALDQDRGRIPPAIYKIGWESSEQVEEQVRLQLDALGLDQMHVGQLCPGGALAEAIRTNGEGLEGIRRMKDDGLVGAYVLEVWPWTSSVPLDALREGHLLGLVDALIFYLNPLQRFLSNDLWDFAQEHGVPMVAMRTVCGGDLDRTRRHGPEYLQGRAEEMTPVYERSGCASWPEFCARFVFGVPHVLATVGATARPQGLKELIEATNSPRPLAADVQNEIWDLQRKWADKHDRLAAPWSM